MSKNIILTLVLVAFMATVATAKKYVPERILKASQQEPVMVMPEDPLFQEDN